MHIVFVGPSEIDDPHVHAIFKRRIATMGNPVVIGEAQDAEAFQKIVDETQASSVESEFCVVSSEPITHDEFCAQIYRNDKQVAEEILLDGKWKNIRFFHDALLPAWRSKLKSLQKDRDEPTIFFIDLGRSLSCLYLAYFCAMDGYNTAIAFHAPPEGEPFSVGGMSVYSRFRGLLRRHLCFRAINGANQVYVDSQAVVGALAKLFPNMSKEILPDPVSDFNFPADDDFLSSGKTA